MKSITSPLRINLGLALACIGLLAGCNSGETGSNQNASPDATASTAATAGAGRSASATVNPASGSNVRGTVRFTEEAGGVRVVADLTGLTPGEHGFHVHEKGDCSAADATSAGDHFNPTKHAHAGRDAEERHIGDLGNIVADASGRGKLDYLDKKLKLTGEHSIVGRSVIVHAKRDDLSSQPSGDAGGRVGCGAIETAQ